MDRSITHALTGEVITFLETTAETNGEYLLIKVDLPPGGDGPLKHYHLAFEEAFEVIEGELELIVGDELIILEAGGTRTVPKTVHHQFKNASVNQPVSFHVKITPPHEFEDSMRMLYGIIADGESNKKGAPKSLLKSALILDMQDTKLTKMPLLLQNFLFNILVKKAKKKGIEAELRRKYVPIEKPPEHAS
ncbi:cupin domain-containing protein [Salsuginibacillus kocurii]|uniref:cupin domain-containing protein n=1 Tax=Salsuginibacillus kocurii TaxID=427078 RepID=UPI0003615E6C|nr:cupin domain-containing protein [Salsuginibacillus kocurii]